PTLLALINPRLGKFNVTAKGGVIERSYFDYRIALPFVVLMALNIAGLTMAARRFQNDPAHRDTIAMNAAWTLYNLVIVAVAASVALERCQRRGETRVDVRVPITARIGSGEDLAGFTVNVSRKGVSGQFGHAPHLERGAPVTLTLGDPGAECNLSAHVASMT